MAVVVAAIPSFLNGFGMNFVCVSVDSFPCPYTGRTQNETTPTDPSPSPLYLFGSGSGAREVTGVPRQTGVSPLWQWLLTRDSPKPGIVP